jgi:hypothetical protein
LFRTSQYPTALALADFTGDGYLDVAAVSTNSNSIDLAFNDATGRLINVATLPTGQVANSIAVGDLDLLVPSFGDNKIGIWKNTDNGTLVSSSTSATANSPADLALGDMDRDGDLDWVATSFYTYSLNVSLNDGTTPLATRPNTGLIVLTCYPNPATDLVQMSLPPATTRVELLDALGRSVCTVPAVSGTATLDVSDLSPGLYVVRAAGQTAHLAVE